MHSIEKELSIAKDTAASATMSASDREQFVEALSKLTTSRAKHKQRADDAEHNLHKYKRNYEKNDNNHNKLTKRLQELTELLSAKNNELEKIASEREVERRQSIENDKLIAKAVLRIKELEEGHILDHYTPRKTKKEGHDDNINNTDDTCELPTAASPTTADGAAASASAIVLASTEAASADIVLLRQQLANCKEELSLVTSMNDEHLQLLNEQNKNIVLLKDSNILLENEIDILNNKLKSEVNELTDKLNESQIELHASNHKYNHIKNELLVVSNDSHDMKLQSDVTARRYTSDIDSITARLHEWEQRCKHAEHMLEENTIHMTSKETDMIHANEKLTSELKTTQQELEKMQREKIELQDFAAISTGGKNSKDDEDETEELLDDDIHQDKGPLTPRTEENHRLQNTLSSMRDNELSLFATLENKLLDLNDARNKLINLKKNSSNVLQKKKILLRVESRTILIQILMITKRQWKVIAYVKYHINHKLKHHKLKLRIVILN